HDVLGHTVSVISLQAAVAGEALADRDHDGALAALDVIREASGGAMAELRATLRSLRAAGAAARPPVPGLDRLDDLVATAAQSGLAVGVRIEGDPVSLPAVVDTTAYRIIQEALTNVLRHARARRTE